MRNLTNYYGYRNIYRMNTVRRINTLFELYSIGRKFRSSTKHKNSDTMLKATILRGLTREPLSISHLGELVSMKPSAMSEKVQELIALGWVAKKQGKDERETLISITTKGQKEVARIMALMDARCAQIFTNVTDRQMQELVTILHKITKNI